MNDIEKAIEQLKHDKENYEELLKEDKPQKPYYLNYGGYNVGNWNHGIACICDYKAPYCRHCGQRLDWSEVE